MRPGASSEPSAHCSQARNLRIARATATSSSSRLLTPQRCSVPRWSGRARNVRSAAGLALLGCDEISSGHAAASRAVTAQGRCRHYRHGRSRSLQVSAQVAAMSGLRGPRLWSAPVCGLRAMAGPLAAIRRRSDAVGARTSESVVSSERQLQVGGRRRTGVPS